MVRFGVRGLVVALCLFAVSAAPAASEEGMWTFDNFPSTRMRDELGWAPDQAWLNRVLTGVARIEGACSAATVSSEGLILTNHHCIRECIAAVSASGRNYLAEGFVVAARQDERRCPGMAVQRLLSVADVTGRIELAAAGVPPEGFAAARDAAISAIERECRGSEMTRRCEVVSLYRGGRYALHAYRRYEDVRLVFAPESEMGHFGGEPDNFNFPRYSLDFAFLRVYENGAPALTPAHLAVRTTPIGEGEITLAPGFPGSTARRLTTAQLAFQRDYALPFRLSMLSELRGRLRAFEALGEDQARLVTDDLLSADNTYKALNGHRLALVDPQSFARITEAELDLQARVRRNRAAQRDIADAWGEIERAAVAYRGFYVRHQMLEVRAGGGPIGTPGASKLFNWARDIVRASAERERPSLERLPRYASTRLPAVEQFVIADRETNPALEEVLLGFWLTKLREDLTLNDEAARLVLGRESPEALAHRLVSTTRLNDAAERARLWRGGAAAVAASDDPMIVFLRAMDNAAREVHLRYQREYEAPVIRASERIAQARFRAFGTTQYPEANFTPRISYGRVAGWTEPDGQVVAPITTIAGLYERAREDRPFRLSRRWAEGRGRVPDDTPIGIATSNDIIGGNSGSPLVDREGRVVGVVFDGNRHSLGGDFYYDLALNRAVSVSTVLIHRALAEIYGADALLAELESAGPVAP